MYLIFMCSNAHKQALELEFSLLKLVFHLGNYGYIPNLVGRLFIGKIWTHLRNLDWLMGPDDNRLSPLSQLNHYTQKANINCQTLFTDFDLFYIANHLLTCIFLFIKFYAKYPNHKPMSLTLLNLLFLTSLWNLDLLFQFFPIPERHLYKMWCH